MSGDRDANGRFKKGGRSANVLGRPPGRSQDLTIERIADLILKAASRKVPQRAHDDGLPMISVAEHVTRAAVSGRPAHRLASESAVDLMRWAAETKEKAKVKRAKQEEARAKLKQIYDY